MVFFFTHMLTAVSPEQVWRLCLLVPAVTISSVRSSASWADTLIRKLDSGISGEWVLILAQTVGGLWLQNDTFICSQIHWTSGLTMWCWDRSVDGVFLCVVLFSWLVFCQSGEYSAGAGAAGQNNVSRPKPRPNGATHLFQRRSHQNYWSAHKHCQTDIQVCNPKTLLMGTLLLKQRWLWWLASAGSCWDASFLSVADRCLRVGSSAEIHQAQTVYGVNSVFSLQETLEGNTDDLCSGHLLMFVLQIESFICNLLMFVCSALRASNVEPTGPESPSGGFNPLIVS